MGTQLIPATVSVHQMHLRMMVRQLLLLHLMVMRRSQVIVDHLAKASTFLVVHGVRHEDRCIDGVHHLRVRRSYEASFTEDIHGLVAGGWIGQALGRRLRVTVLCRFVDCLLVALLGRSIGGPILRLGLGSIVLGRTRRVLLVAVLGINGRHCSRFVR